MAWKTRELSQEKNQKQMEADAADGAPDDRGWIRPRCGTKECRHWIPVDGHDIVHCQRDRLHLKMVEKDRRIENDAQAIEVGG